MASQTDDLTVLTTHHCLDLLRSSEVGRLAISRTAHPDVFPVNYAIDGDDIVFRTAPGTKLDMLTRNRDVTFEVDGFDHGTADAWSVIIKGRAERITAPHDLFEVGDLPLYPWHTGPKPHFVRIVPLEMTGRRFQATRPSPAQRAAPPTRRAAHE